MTGYVFFFLLLLRFNSSSKKRNKQKDSLKRVHDAVEHGHQADRVRERVVGLHGGRPHDSGGQVPAQDREDHRDDVEHRRLHRVEAHEVVDLVVPDDGEVDEEEDDEGRELGRVVVLDERT